MWAGSGNLGFLGWTLAGELLKSLLLAACLSSGELIPLVLPLLVGVLTGLTVPELEYCEGVPTLLARLWLGLFLAGDDFQAVGPFRDSLQSTSSWMSGPPEGSLLCESPLSKLAF